MFRSTQRNCILPQFEHSRLAGMLAWHWGNEVFDRPAINFEAFARGVTLHDWHYGVFDDHPLGAYDTDEWFAIASAGVDVSYDDPVTDIVAKYHLRRLIGTPGEPRTEQLVRRLQEKIDARLAETPYSAQEFEWADRITRFCDSVAFDFGFEHRGWHERPVFASRRSHQQTQLNYEICQERVIRIHPWPFSVDGFSEQVLIFPRANYPSVLQPHVILACIEPV